MSHESLNHDTRNYTSTNSSSMCVEDDVSKIWHSAGLKRTQRPTSNRPAQSPLAVSTRRGSLRSPSRLGVTPVRVGIPLIPARATISRETSTHGERKCTTRPEDAGTSRPASTRAEANFGSAPKMKRAKLVGDDRGKSRMASRTTQPEQASSEVLAGLVERVTFHHAENGFCVLRVKARGHRQLITVVGHAATIAAGE